MCLGTCNAYIFKVSYICNECRANNEKKPLQLEHQISFCFIKVKNFTYVNTHIMKNKQPKISNYFETSQILVLIKQPD